MSTKKKGGGFNRLGSKQQKILLLLMTGVALGLCGSPKQYFRVVDAFREDWKNINDTHFKRAVSGLKQRGFIQYKKCKDGTVIVQLTNAGERKGNQYRCENLKIEKPKKWDKKWHVVAFDIPIGLDGARSALRYNLRRIGFVELQHSVWIHPYSCKKVIAEITGIFNVTDYVSYMRVEYLDQDISLRKHFRL